MIGKLVKWVTTTAAGVICFLLFVWINCWIAAIVFKDDPLIRSSVRYIAVQAAMGISYTKAEAAKFEKEMRSEAVKETKKAIKQ